MLRSLAAGAALLLGGCGLFEEHKSRNGETVYRISPQAATNIVQSVGSVIASEAQQPSKTADPGVIRTTYSMEVTGRAPLTQAVPTITTEEVSICLSPKDCLRVVDNGAGQGQITGDFNGFEFVLSNPQRGRFFHARVGQEVVFGLAPNVVPQAILANVRVKNLGNNNFEVRLRAENYPEYDIDAALTFDERGELVSCVARRLSTGQQTTIEDIPPST